MKTIILNGSPKGSSATSNTNIFIKSFMQDMKNDCEVRCIAKENLKELAQYIKNFESIIIVMPLYIHAMPGIVMKFIECLEPAVNKGQSIGFIIQAGFPESAHERFVEQYFAQLAKQYHYQYLGTVSKGGAASVYRTPENFKRLYALLADLGRIYEEQHIFDKEIVKKLGMPYAFSKFELWLIRLADKMGMLNASWNKLLKQNNALENAYDKPFL